MGIRPSPDNPSDRAGHGAGGDHFGDGDGVLVVGRVDEELGLVVRPDWKTRWGRQGSTRGGPVSISRCAHLDASTEGTENVQRQREYDICLMRVPVRPSQRPGMPRVAMVLLSEASMRLSLDA